MFGKGTIKPLITICKQKEAKNDEEYPIALIFAVKPFNGLESINAFDNYLRTLEIAAKSYRLS